MRTLQFIGNLSRRRRGNGGGTPHPPDNTPNGLGEGIEFTLPNFEMRVGTAYSLGITPPTGYSVTWAIQDAHSLMPGRTPRVLATGTGTTASWTPTTSVDLSGRHLFVYLTAIVTKGTTLAFFRRSKKMRVAPPRVTSEDAFNVVWNFSTGNIEYKDNNRVDRTNYKIGVKGTGTSSAWLGLEEWISTNPDQPCTIQNVPGQIARINHTGTNYGLKITQGCQNLFIDGGGDPNIDYGIELNMVNNGAQILYIEGWGTNASTATKNVAITRVKALGNNVVQGAGFEIATSNAAGLNYDSGFTVDGISIYDCYIQETVSEGVYVGRFTDDQGYAPITNLTLLRIHTKHTGADGIQWGLCRNSEISECFVEDAGHRNDPNHRNAWQVNPGNKNVYAFRNTSIGSINTLSMNTGAHGGAQEFFANLYVNKTSNMPSNFFINLQQNSDSSSIDVKFIRSTLISPTGASGNVPFYIAKQTGGVTTIFNKLIIADFTIINKDTTQYATLNSPNLSEAVIDNYITTSANAPMFQNYTANQYNLTSLNSPAFQSVNNAYSAAHPLAAEDIDGYQYKRPVNGAYSGVYLMT